MNDERADRPIMFPAPLLAVDTDELDFGQVRQPDQKSMSFTVSNIGGKGNLSVMIDPNPPNQPWFSVEPVSFSQIPPGQSRLVVVALNTEAKGCQPGTPILNISVTCEESMIDKKARIDVKAEIQPPLELIVEPPKLEFGKVSLGESKTLTFVVRKSNQEDVEIEDEDIDVFDSQGQSRRPWVEISCLPKGPALAKTVSITFHTANRKERERYDGKLILRDRDNECQPAEVPIGLTVEEPPRLNYKWDRPPLPFYTGTQQEAYLTITNVGKGLLRGEVRGTKSWLSTGDSQFQLIGGESKTMGIVFNARNLEIGVYQGDLEIHCNDEGRFRTRRITFELKVVSLETQPLEVMWESDMGSVYKGDTVHRDLVVRNLLGNSFSGVLVAKAEGEAGNWLLPARQTLELAPGEVKPIDMHADTQSLGVHRGGSPYDSSLSVGSSAKEWWQGEAHLRVVPRPNPVPLWLRVLVPLLLLALIFGGYKYWQFHRPHPKIPPPVEKVQTTHQAAARLVAMTMAPVLGEGLAAFAALEPGSAVVVRGSYDHIEDVLPLLKIRPTVVNPTEVGTVNLDSARVVLVDCPGILNEAGVGNLRRFVEKGGYLFTTDWCLRFILQSSFGDCIAWNGAYTREEMVDARVVDQQNPLCKGVQPGTSPAKWAIWGSQPIQVVRPSSVTVLLESEQMQREYGTTPVAVNFRLGQGSVLHITGHVVPPHFQKRSGLDAQSGESFATDELRIRGRIPKSDRALLSATSTGELRDAFSMQKLCANFLLEKLAVEAQAHYTAGDQAYQQKDYETAAKEFALSGKRSPRWDPPFYMLGRSCYERNKLSEARAALKRAISIQDKAPKYWVWLGKVEQKAGNAREARKAYERALKLDRNDAEAQEGLTSLR